MDTQELQKKIELLERRVLELEKTQIFVGHKHTGFDSDKVRLKDLETILYASATIDPGSLADGAGSTHQITGVNGATLGDFVVVAAPYDLQDITVTGYVQANSTVEIRIQNESGSVVDLASGLWRVLIIKKIV